MEQNQEKTMTITPLEVSLFYTALQSAICHELENEDNNSQFMISQYEKMSDKILKEYYGMAGGR